MTLIDAGTLTSVPGVLVGHWTSAEARTGCTVISLPMANVTTCDVRGAAPATRETALLAPGMTVQRVDAIVLSGGSAFGLAAADGVVQALEEAGRGHPTRHGPVPIVPAASLYDLGVGDSTVRPTSHEGRIAFEAASAAPVPLGPVGAGTGATVSKWRGEPRAAGIGSAAVAVGDAIVAVIVAVNALGDVFSLEGTSLTGGPHVPGPLVIPEPLQMNTTLVVVATSARLDREALSRLSVRAHDALGACLRPAHTMFDGDICFASSVGDIDAEPHALAEAAFVATARSLELVTRVD